MEVKDLYQIFLNHQEVTTDSRDCPEGSIFFALKGESFNGNQFAMKALESGCAYAVIDEADYLVSNNMDADVFVCANDFLVKHIYC